MMREQDSSPLPEPEKETPLAGRGNDPGRKTDQEPLWFLYLILQFMFGNPLLDTCSFIMRLDMYEKEGIVWMYPDIFRFYTGYGWFVVISCSLASLYTGYVLGERRNRESLRLARWMFWLNGPFQVILLQGVYCLFFVSISGSAIFGYVMLPMAWSLLWTLVWTAWLGKSRRAGEIFRYSE